MKKFYSTPFKTAAIFLSVIMLVMVFASVCIVITMVDAEAYTSTYEDARKNVMMPQLYRIANELYYSYCDYYHTANEPYDNIASEYADEGIYVRINDDETNLLYDTVPDDFDLNNALSVEIFKSCFYGEFAQEGLNEQPESLTLFVDQRELKNVKDLRFIAMGFDKLYSLRYISPVIGCIAIIAFFSLIVFLFCGAGNTVDNVGIRLSFVDKIPLDMLTAIYMVIAAGFIIIINSVGSSIIMFLTAIPVYLLALLYCMSIAVRIKANTIIKNNVITVIIKWLWNLMKRMMKLVRECMRSLPIIWKTVLLFILCSIAEFSLLILFVGSVRYEPGDVLFCSFIFKLITIPIILIKAIHFKRIKQGMERIAEGDTGFHVDTSYMRGDFLDIANRLNDIGDGLTIAVDERIKSERFKMELITNVSHDIKTPLTSIINYVDFIKKHGTNDEKLSEYVDVLERQSKRLKKLIEDIMEASKASTGNLNVNLELCELDVAISQAIGEYREMLEEREIEILITSSDKPVYAMADGRHLWRILDNLLNNVIKYAQSGTRLYISLVSKENQAMITFKNISQCPLNISGEELMERFVRGDASRHTEGSGLGLNIAKSLAELQNATLEIIIDGDLFKTILTFNQIVPDDVITKDGGEECITLN